MILFIYNYYGIQQPPALQIFKKLSPKSITVLPTNPGIVPNSSIKLVCVLFAILNAS